ncbi:MAG: glycoside hydrolase family 5 protein [Colwellia sp.]|nr:glycoside hydrolase family 5 protein [Colwellia sp.]
MTHSSSKGLLPKLVLLMLTLLSFFSLANITPVEKHGSLAIENGQLVNQNHQAVSLAGPSLFWSNNGWSGEEFYSKEVVTNISKQWQASIIRVAMGADFKGSYLTFPEDNLLKVTQVIEAAIDNNIYVIIDWHSHHAERDVEQAVHFFQLMAKKYGHLPHIIYEIYNEPLKNTDWHSVIKPYAIEVIKAIRAIDKDNIILVGTQSWSQDVDISAKNPIKNVKNIAYSLHFYAGTHREELRQKAQQALDAGLALFVSEWGTVTANGDGAVDYLETEKWLAFIRKNKLSHCSWALSRKNEGAAIFTAEASITGPWPDEQLTTNGRYLKNIISNWGY